MASIKRTDFKDPMFHVKGGKFGKPDLYQVKVGERTLMVKDVRGRSFFFRWTLGLWLIRNEWEVYSRLLGIRGIPRALERIDRFAFVTEFVRGRPLQRGESLPASFFSDLERILNEIHLKGVVHLDMRHKGNILISQQGDPYLIDFNSSVAFGKRGWIRHYLFPLLQQVDCGGMLKLKARVSPTLMTPEETASLRRFNRIRRLWIFN
jgi:RIO-like serine/threonine protein kinase